MPHGTVLRSYRDDDLEPALALWLAAWQTAMPEFDFVARLPWWRDRWLLDLVPARSIVVAERSGTLVGFIVIDPGSGWLDQLVVHPSRWGKGDAVLLIEEAKRCAPNGVTLDVNQSNLRAVRFYEREGFVRTGAGVNSISGAPTWIYRWKPAR